MGGREEFGDSNICFFSGMVAKAQGDYLGFGLWTEGQWGGYREIQSLYHGGFNTQPLAYNI